MERKITLALILGIFLLSGVTASYSLKSFDIQTSYSGGSRISGKINISFNNEPGLNTFTSNFPGNITLLDLIKNNSYQHGRDYNCSTAGCNKDYSSQSEISQIGLNDSIIVGLKVFGSDITNIESVKINLRGNGGDSCLPPVFVDFLADSEYKIIPDKYTEFDSCFSPNYGCFDKNLGNYQQVSLTNIPYCEKMTLPVAPAYKIGAVVKNSTNGAAVLTMQLYDNEGIFLKECNLPGHTQAEQELNCIVNYTSPIQDEYLVCIIGKNIGNNGPNYAIKSETQGQICGTDNLGSTFGRDYDIVARPLRFAQIDLEINDSLFEKLHGDRLSNYVFDYIFEKYNGGECDPECIIPISMSGISQNIDFSNILISYRDGNTLVSDDAIYSISQEEPKVTSKILNLDLAAANFVIPIDSSARKFDLYLNGQALFSKNINVTKGFDFDVNPKFVAFGQAVNFIISSPSNISKATWNFGDGKIETINGKSAGHTYLQEGNFVLKVDAYNTNGSISSKQFTINVGNAKDSGRIFLDDYNARITDLKKVLLTYPSWIHDVFEASLDIEGNEALLSDLEERYDSASNDSEYVDIMTDILELDIPKSINSSVKGSAPLTAISDIDTSYIRELSMSSEAGDDALKNAIRGWMSSNLDADVSFEEINKFYPGETIPLASSFKIDITPRGEENSYLIIPFDIQDLEFKSDYGQMSVSGGAYIEISGRKTIEFIILEKVSIDELGAYVSPPIEKFGVLEGEEIEEYEPPGFRWGFFTSWILILLAIAFVVYIILQEWYKRNYEKSLFKNEESLYNLINFIYNARNSGLTDGQIRARLKDNKWNGEQITYAIRKLDGKRTGMFEIPIFRFMEKRKVREEINKRGGNTTFIKRPGF